MIQIWEAPSRDRDRRDKLIHDVQGVTLGGRGPGRESVASRLFAESLQSGQKR